MSLVEVRGLAKTFRSGRGRRGRFETRAVDDVSFTLEAGRTLAIVGESGAGKSTVGRMVLRLIEPDAGSVRLDGIDVLSLDRRSLRRTRARMQMVFQDPFTALDPRVRVGHAIEEALVVHTDLGRDERWSRAVELLGQVGLGEHLAGRFSRELSGGQLQRAVIARALASNPDFLVCDEPVSALDVSIRAQIINLLLDLQRDRQLAILFISHDLSLVRAIAHDVGVMRGGVLLEMRPTQELFEDPHDPYTSELLAAIPGSRRRGQEARVPGTDAVPHLERNG